jgi:hypothetical protein
MIVGYRSDLNGVFQFPEKSKKLPTLRDAIWDIQEGEQKLYPVGSSNWIWRETE